MGPTTNRRLSNLVSAFALSALAGWSVPSDAAIQRIVIDQTATVSFTPIIPGTSTPGAATSYTVYTGRSFGSLDPTTPDNSIITDIALAPKNAGKVEYVANFQIVTPAIRQSATG